MKRILSSALAFIAVSFAVASWAEPPMREYSFDIARQPLSDMLREFSKQTALSVAFLRKSHDQEEIMVGPLKGRYTPESALSELLSKSGMTFVRVNEFTIAVKGATDVAVHPDRVRGIRTLTDAGDSESGYLRVADRRLAARPGVDAGAHEDVQQPGVDPASRRDRGSGERESVSIEEVVTAGSRLRRAPGEEPSPVVIVDREKIERLGVTSLPEVLRYTTQQTFTNSETTEVNGAQFAQLRGLPIGSTTVLVNGRRTGLSANDANSNGIDLNMIPLAAVERVEILADSASAMYGADAIGGVVNIVLKKDISRPVADIRYGGADGGGEERRVSLTGGLSGERYRGGLLVDYFEQDPLLGEERDRWSNQDYRRFGGTDRRVPNAAPGTLVSSTAGNLPGLGSRFALVREGSSGVGLTSADFVPVPTEADLRTESIGRFEPIIMEKNRRSAVAFGEFDLTESATIFAEAFYTDAEVLNQSNPFATSLTVPIDNPFNPFGQPVVARYLFEGVGPQRNRLEEDLYSATAGLKGRLMSWDWEVSALRTKSTSLYRQNENTVNIAQANCLLTNPAGRAPGACGGITEALNVFQDGPGGSAALLASLVGTPSVFDGRAEGTQVDAFVRGAVGTLPAGAIEMVVGGAHGSDDIRSRQISPTTLAISGDRSSSAGFAEMRIPLVAATMQMPGVRSLTLKLAGRYDQYSDFGDTFNPQYGLVWMPVADVSLTASYGTSFSPPSLFQLYSPRTTRANIAVPDPARNNETAFISLITGGNPDLDPEEGTSFIAGIVLTPRRVAGLRVSTHYWKVVLDERVSSLNVLTLLGSESLFPERIVRAAPDVAGLPGRLISVNSSLTNFAHLETSGVDWAAAYSLDTRWGRLSPSLSATWTETYESIDRPNTPAVDRVGVSSAVGTIPRWRAVLGLGWERDGVGLSTLARYVQGVFHPGSNRHVPSQTLIDMNAFLETPSSFAKDFKISAGVLNVFDKEPAFVDNSFGYDWTQTNLVGRSFYVNLSKGF